MTDNNVDRARGRDIYNYGKPRTFMFSLLDRRKRLRLTPPIYLSALDFRNSPV